MDHPDTKKIEKWGYPKYPDGLDESDSLGNPLYKDDEVYVYDDETFVIEELSTDACRILEILGADRRTI